jgi:predicted membrane protein
MNKEKRKENQKGDFSNLLLWWRIDKDELRKQIDKYDSLSLSQSARGQSIICLMICVLLTTILIIFFGYDKMNFIDIIIFLILSFFIFRGHRWAIIIAMILWTIEKSLLLVDISMAKKTPINPILQIMWWALFMHYFYLAFRVERSRVKIKRITGSDLNIRN